MTGHPASLLVQDDQPLIGVIAWENGHEVTRYFTDDTQADIAATDSVQKALSLAGAWADMDWEEALEELERIGHEVPPTPPIDL